MLNVLLPLFFKNLQINDSQIKKIIKRKSKKTSQ
jgi:hypothetical protein